MKSLKDSMTEIYEGPRFHLLAAALIAVLTLLAYSNTFQSSFHFDDTQAINDNQAIKHVSSDNIMALLHTTRPITMLSLMFSYATSGLNVVGWHVFNLFFHIANSILVYVFILWTVTLPVFHERYRGKARGMALFGALLFAVHPIQTEAVTYIISRSELIASFFFLGTFLLFIRGIQKDRFGYYVLALITSLCAMGSKEWAATLPAMLVLYDYLFVSQGSFPKVMKRWPAYALLFLPWVLAAYILSLYEGATSAGFSISGLNGITPWTYLLTSFNIIWTYARLLVLPINQNLDYDYHLATTLFEFPTLLSFVGHLFVIGAAFWTYKKKGWLLAPFGVAWFYIILSPTQSFVPIKDIIFEHRLYLPSLGLFIAFLAGYEALFIRLSGKEWIAEEKPVIAPQVVKSRKAQRKTKKLASG
jgi:protein O-mannosyl-transferase